MRDDDKWSLVFVVGAKRVDGGCVGCGGGGWVWVSVCWVDDDGCTCAQSTTNISLADLRRNKDFLSRDKFEHMLFLVDMLEVLFYHSKGELHGNLGLCNEPIPKCCLWRSCFS